MKKKNFPVMWFEGMPVTAHLFQQDFIYNHNNLNNLFSNFNANNFGIINIEWEINQLNNNILYLKNLEAILPDFTHILIQPEDNLQIDLSKYKNILKEKELFIFINMPNNYYSDKNNVPFFGYVTSQNSVSDLNDKTNSAIIALAKPNLFLSADENQNLANISLPIAKIVFNNINIELTSYYGPTLNIKNNKVILNSILKIIEKAKNKFYYLKIKKYTTYHKDLSIYLLSKLIYILENFYINNTHPEEVFNKLNEIMADMLFFHKDKKLITPQAYSHYHYQEQINNLLVYINASIDNIYESYIQTRFHKENNQFFINIENETNYAIIGIEKNENLSLQETINWLNECIICSQEDLEKNKVQRTLGLERSIIDSFKESNISEIQGVILVQINDKIKKDNLIILNSNSILQPNTIFLFTLDS